MKHSVIIPTLDPGPLLRPLITALRTQTLAPDEIIVVDSASGDGTAALARELGCQVVPIARRDFDHGGTRQMAANLAVGDILIYLTQDALPAGDDALAALARPFANPKVAACGGRQLPHKDANPLAVHARLFNYPPESCVKTRADIPRLGIKTPFLSNSFAAYRKSVLQEIGGFPNSVTQSEDMHVAARMLLAGYAVAYEGAAQVFHSHNLTPWQEFTRYRSIGAFHRQNPWIEEAFGKTKGEGLRYLRSELRHARAHGLGWVLRSFLTCGAKYVGFKLG